MTGYHDEQLPFGIVPVLAFRDARAADVDADLSAVHRMYQLRKASPVITIHLKGILKLFFWQIGQIQAEQLFRKASFRHLWHHQRRWLLLKLLQQIHDLP